MNMFLVLYWNFLLVLIDSSSLEDDYSVEHYLNLINNYQHRYSTYSLPNDASAYRPTRSRYVYYGTFDHIIVGAGSAGAIIANRLSEDPSKHILLLEAGGHETEVTDIPTMAGYSLGLEYNWNYVTIPQNTSCLGMKDRQCGYPRGKGLGGSTIINGLIYTRGNKMDYENWRNQGNIGWSYEDVLPYFKKSENSKISGDAGYHGYKGYLNTEYQIPDYQHFFTFIDGNQELQRNLVDYNGKEQLGVGKSQLNNVNGRRGSTGRTFLRPIWHRKNLKILTDSYVIKILIDSKSKRAFGILFVKDKKYFVVKARNDIIISAGTIGSPQLLLLSGIGPKTHLEELGIPVIADLPVGNNFQDHMGYPGLQFASNYTQELKDLESCIRDYLNGVGPFTNAYNEPAVAFLQTNLSEFPTYPNVEITIGGFESQLLQKLYNYNEETVTFAFTGIDPTHDFVISVVLLHPKSTGYLKLKSANPFDYPIINTRFLTDLDGDDIETMYQGIQLTLKLLDTQAFKRWGIHLKETHLPACKNHAYSSKAYWYCHLRQIATSYAHPFGTCRMGQSSTTSVVNHELKVFGIKNLRVADASIMPGSISGHTNAPAMMIGEKAVDLIKFS